MIIAFQYFSRKCFCAALLPILLLSGDVVGTYPDPYEYPKCRHRIVEERENKTILWDPDWTYASHSEIHTDRVTLYAAQVLHPKNKVVAINAGHGTAGGDDFKTLCHPDGSPKVTGGSTAKGEIYAAANSSGMTFPDGTPEAEVTLQLAQILKEQLLLEGYDVLMLRDYSDSQLDNVARAVFANENADIHISLHYDSTDSDKGLFAITVPENGTYRSMEPVASHWQDHMALAQALVEGAQKEGVKIFGSGYMPIDLTQTSYSTIPSVCVEVGDRASDYSSQAQKAAAAGLVQGINEFFHF